ncbi:hypothetical protein [Ureibacillus chungkukjangi]|nr:hypothetical protein [Ureibacillus chungkukjangi]
MGSINENNKFVKSIQRVSWFQKSYLAGIMLLLVNAVLFFGSLGILNALMIYFGLYVHFFVMLVAVVLSIGSWIIVNKAWNGSNRGRIVIAGIGSSFYFVLTILFVYRYMSIEPYYPGEDTFMRALGLTLAGITTVIAWITCFVITGFSSMHKSNEKYNSTAEVKNSQ